MLIGILYPLMLLNSTLNGNLYKIQSIGQGRGIQFEQIKNRGSYILRKNHIIMPRKFLISQRVLYKNPKLIKRFMKSEYLIPAVSPYSSSLSLLTSLLEKKKSNELSIDPTHVIPATINHNSGYHGENRKFHKGSIKITFKHFNKTYN